MEEDSIINWYECPICYYKSRNKEKIERCLAQGRKNRYQVGQKVEFHFVGQNNYDFRKEWYRAEVRRINFGKLNHRVSYTILLTDSDLPPTYHGREIKIPEPYVRAIP